MADAASDELKRESWRQLAKELLTSGGDAAKIALVKLVAAVGESAAHAAEKATDGGTIHSRRVIEAHTMLARGQGALVASGLTAAEVTSVVGTAGATTPAVVGLGILTDLAGLAWIQVRMVLIIAALHGFDPTHSYRVKELGALMGLNGPVPTEVIAEMAGRRVPRVLKRLVLRHLKGDVLKAVKSMFRLVGINFARSVLVKQLPLVNIPVSMVINGSATAALGRKALKYYDNLSPATKVKAGAS